MDVFDYFFEIVDIVDVVLGIMESMRCGFEFV